MSVVNLANFKEYVGSRIKADDAFLQAALDATDVFVADYCARSFTTIAVDGATSARLYVPTGSDVLRIHDCIAVTAVTESGTAVTASTYQLEPTNALSWSGQARSYEQIRRLGSCWWQTDTYAHVPSISVTARWGWLTVPASVTEATKILARDIVGQRDVRGDTESFGEFGATRAVIKQAERLLNPYRRVEAFGIA